MPGSRANDQDVFVNAVGGVRISGARRRPGGAAAIVSSLTDKPLPGKVAVFGEVGLAGEVRPAPARPGAPEGGRQARLHAGDHPQGQSAKQKIEGLEVIAVERVAEAVAEVSALESA